MYPPPERNTAIIPGQLEHYCFFTALYRNQLLISKLFADFIKQESLLPACRRQTDTDPVIRGLQSLIICQLSQAKTSSQNQGKLLADSSTFGAAFNTQVKQTTVTAARAGDPSGTLGFAPRNTPNRD